VRLPGLSHSPLLGACKEYWRNGATLPRGGIPDAIENMLKQDREDGLPDGIQFGILSRASDALG